MTGRSLKAVKEAFPDLNKEARTVCLKVNKQETEVFVVETKKNVCVWSVPYLVSYSK